MQTWGARTERLLDKMVKHFTVPEWRIEVRAELRARWWAQYVAEREAYLDTLPETSRMGRLIWIHARRQEHAR